MLIDLFQRTASLRCYLSFSRRGCVFACFSMFVCVCGHVRASVGGSAVFALAQFLPLIILPPPTRAGNTRQPKGGVRS